MDCIDDKKGSNMTFIKKYLPYIIGVLVGSLLVYFFFPKIAGKRIETTKKMVKDPVENVVKPVKRTVEDASNVIIQEMCPEPKVIVKQSPPEIKTVVKWKEKIVYKDKIVFKDRVVYKEPETKMGCHVDWKTGKATGYAPQGTTLICNVDYKNKKINERFYKHDGMLRFR